MPISPLWIVPEARVFTPIGYGTINGRLCGNQIEIRLDKPWDDNNITFSSPGEIVLDTDFTLVRIANVDAVGIIFSAINYPSWKEVIDLAMMAPYCEDETLIGLNFATHEGVCARVWNHLGNYHHLECGFDRYNKNFPLVSETRDQALLAWQENVGPLSGTSGALLLEVLLAFEDDAIRVLAQKILGTAMVLKDELY